MSIGISSGLVGFKQGLKEGYHSLGAPLISDKDCRLFLPLNSAPNKKTPDSSGYGNHGTLYGPILEDIGEEYYLKFKGKLINVGGKALSFDGVDDYIDCGNDSSINIFDPFTVEAWAKLEAKGSDRDIATNGAAPVSWELRYDVGEDLWYFNMYDGAWQYAKYAQENVVLGVWYHLVGILDNHNLKIYVNGILGSITDTVGTMYDPSNYSFIIGRLGNSTDRQFSGLISLVRLYSRALSEKEIKEHFELERVLFGV